MTIDVGRAFADVVIAELDRYTRAAAAPKGANAKGGQQEPANEGKALPTPIDPETAMQEILGVVQDTLEWDGQSGDPNDSLEALETALADMFDADVEILWDGQATITMYVEGEEPIPLSADYLGELLEELAKQGGEGGAPEGDAEGGEADDEGEPDGKLPTERAWRGAVVDKHGHHHAASGKDGGQFVSKGGAVADAAGAAGKAVMKGAKAAASGSGGSGSSGGSGGKGGGPRSARDLAGRAAGRAGPRATAKAVDETLSAGTGKRVKVKGDPNGRFVVGRKKTRMNGKQVAIHILARWMALNAAGYAASALLGPGALLVAAPISLTVGIAELVRTVKILKSADPKPPKPAKPRD